MKRVRGLAGVILVAGAVVTAQEPALITVNFASHVRTWDGFGVNYVEVPQTRDYAASPQEYGGFSALSEAKRQEILELTFGDDGLRPGIVKMFLDPWHEGTTKAGNDNADPWTIDPARFDHATTTKWMRYFVKEGLKRTRARGGDLQVITTLYGPQPWTTTQKFVRGRDLDPAERDEVAEYVVAWAKWLKEQEGIPVRWISLHNEGEDFSRWPVDGKDAGHSSHDYNMFWPPWQVNEVMKVTRRMLDAHGLKDIGVTPGEPTNWYRFVMWGYATAIAADPEALAAMGLITSHGFTGGGGEWFADWRSTGIDYLRLRRPELHAWTTSMTWGRMDHNFVVDIIRQIYETKVNALIPWAAVQTSKWVGGDPNPGTAFRVIEDCGCYTVLPGYYFYKQISRAGQPGTAVARVRSSEPTIHVAAFSKNGTAHADAIVIANTSRTDRPLTLEIAGTAATRFAAFRTTTAGADRFTSLGTLDVANGRITMIAAEGSATTLLAR